MAELTALSGKITLALDSGEVLNGKPVYRSITIRGVNGAATADKLASSAATMGGLLSLPVEKTTLQRTDLISQ